jgi:hypothetical protein
MGPRGVYIWGVHRSEFLEFTQATRVLVAYLSSGNKEHMLWGKLF